MRDTSSLISLRPKLPVLPVVGVNSHAFESWNGATQVAHWRFFGTAYHSPADRGPDAFEELGSVKKVSFESSMAVPGVWQYVYAEAVDANGGVIGRSDAVLAGLGGGWGDEDFEEVEEEMEGLGG